MDGWLDWRQAHGLQPVKVRGRPLKWREVRGYLGKSGRHVKAPIRLVVPRALSFEIRDRAKIGITVPERFESHVDRVEVVGLMDCDLTIWAPTPTASYFEVASLDLGECEVDAARGVGMGEGVRDDGCISSAKTARLEFATPTEAE